jgi:methanogenic corrinoid protein MtbC1
MTELANALATLDETKVARLVTDKIKAGVGAASIVDELRQGMDTVGEKYRSGDYFLSELIVSRPSSPVRGRREDNWQNSAGHRQG